LIKSGVDVDKVKQQCQEFWKEKKKELPDIDELGGHLQNVGNQTKGLIDGAVEDLIINPWNVPAEDFGAFWGGLRGITDTVGNTWNNVRGITDTVDNAWNGVSGIFR